MHGVKPEHFLLSSISDLAEEGYEWEINKGALLWRTILGQTQMDAFINIQPNRNKKVFDFCSLESGHIQVS